MQYRVAMTALAGNAMACEGSTTTRGKYAKNIRLAVDYLVDLAELGGGTQPSGLIGYKNDYHTVSTRGTTLDAPRSFRLDARLAWTPRPGWELFVAGSNLLQPYTVEYADGSANPRVVRGGLSARFAP